MKHYVLMVLLLCAMGVQGQNNFPVGATRPQDTSKFVSSIVTDGDLRLKKLGTSDPNKVLGVDASGKVVAKDVTVTGGGHYIADSLKRAYDSLYAHNARLLSLQQSTHFIADSLKKAYDSLYAHNVRLLSLEQATGGGGHFIADSLKRAYDSLAAHNVRLLSLQQSTHFIADSIKRSFDSLLAHNVRLLALEQAGFISDYTETDPVSVAKTVTITTGWGLSGGAAAKTVGSNPAWPLTYDSSTVFPALLTTMGAGYAMIKSGRTYIFDSATAFVDFLSTLATGYGITKSGRTFKADTGTLFSYYTGTLAAGTGISISGRTIVNSAPDQVVSITAGYSIAVTGTYPNFVVVHDTATGYVKVLSTLAAGYGLNYTGRTFKLDTATVYPGIVGTFGAGTNISITGRTIGITGIIGLNNGGTAATAQTSLNAVPVTYGANNDLSGTYALISGASFTGAVVIPKLSTNNQTGTTYTLVIGDAGKWVTSNNASAVTITVPPNSSVAFPVDSYVSFSNYGAGTVTISAGSGVTINGTDANRKFVQYADGYIHKVATDTWIIGGKTSN